MSCIIIDCDAGRDDALAIWLALRLGHKLVGVISSYGNTTQDNVTENCLRILAYARRSDIPVFSGLKAPITHHKGVDDVVLPRQAMSGNGMCNLTLPPSNALSHDVTAQEWADYLRKMAAEHGPIDYIITGPASNFAQALSFLGDDAHKVIARVIMWAGKLEWLWATNPGAEFNTICDPFAVQALLDSGLPVIFTPMDTTWQINLPLPAIEALVPENEIAHFAKDLMIAHCKYFAPEPIFRFHDPCTVLALASDAPISRDIWRINTNMQDAEFGRTCSVMDGADIGLYTPDAQGREGALSTILTQLGLTRA